MHKLYTDLSGVKVLVYSTTFDDYYIDHPLGLFNIAVFARDGGVAGSSTCYLTDFQDLEDINKHMRGESSILIEDFRQFFRSDTISFKWGRELCTDNIKTFLYLITKEIVFYD